jgi:hypothetical protein
MSSPQKKKNSININKFDGGLVTKIQPSDLLVNQSPDLKNVEFNEVGYIKTSRGFSEFNTAIHASYPIDGIAVHKASSTATEYMIVACNSGLYRVNDSGTVSSISQGTGILTATNDVKFTHYKNQLFFSDNISNGYRYDGDTVFQAGIQSISAPATIVSGSTASTSFATGIYEYGITGISNTYQENGFVNIGSYTLGVASHNVHISSIGVYPSSAGVTSRNLYRKNPGGTIFYYIDNIPNNSATTYIDEKTLTTTNLPADLGAMPKHAFMVEYNGILYCSGNPDYPTRLYYSEAGYPEYWPPANYREIGGDDGYPITGLRIYNGTVIIHKNDGYGVGSIYILDVSDITVSPTSAVLVKSNAQLSANSDKAIVGHDSMLSFFNRKGIFNFLSNALVDNPQYSSLGSFQVDSISFPIEDLILSIGKEYLKKVAAIEHESKIYLSGNIGDENGQNNSVFIYDHSSVSNTGKDSGAWLYRSDHYINNFVEYKGFLYAGASNKGVILRLDKDNFYRHNSSAIDSYYITPFIYGAPEHKFNTKTWRYIDIGLVKLGNWNLEFGYRSDGTDEWLTETISLKPESALWDDSYWDIDYWTSSGISREYKRIVFQSVTSTGIQFKFGTNVLDGYFIIFDLNVNYNLRGERGV